MRAAGVGSVARGGEAITRLRRLATRETPVRPPARHRPSRTRGVLYVLPPPVVLGAACSGCLQRCIEAWKREKHSEAGVAGHPLNRAHLLEYFHPVPPRARLSPLRLRKMPRGGCRPTYYPSTLLPQPLPGLPYLRGLLLNDEKRRLPQVLLPGFPGSAFLDVPRQPFSTVNRLLAAVDVSLPATARGRPSFWSFTCPSGRRHTTYRVSLRSMNNAAVAWYPSQNSYQFV